MKRKHRLYSKPKKAYEATRIAEENKLVAKYGLKNKREIWKAIAKIRYFRTRAKRLVNATTDEQEVLLNKLKMLGLKTNTIPDVLALDKEDLLKRRLSTVIFAKGLAKTPKQARQLVVHKKILINEKVVDSPSYIVSVGEENQITIKLKTTQQKPAGKQEEVKTANEGEE